MDTVADVATFAVALLLLVAIVVITARVVFRRTGNSAGTHVYRCPCCGYKTLSEPSSNEICQVCFWQDDGQDDSDADEVLGGPNYELSLSAARRNFQEFGAVSRKYIKNVRAPRPDEL